MAEKTRGTIGIERVEIGTECTAKCVETKYTRVRLILLILEFWRVRRLFQWVNLPRGVLCLYFIVA